MILEISGMLIISIVYLALFSAVEIYYRRFNPKTEITRKIVHFSSGIIASIFPIIFRSIFSVLILGVVFTVFLAVARRLRLLRSVIEVDRKTLGEIYFPVSIAILFLLARKEPAFYTISILMLAVSDPIGALIGKTYGSVKYYVQSEQKSLEGSVMFFLSSFLLIHIGLLLFTEVSRINSVLVSFLAALLVTALELISLEGMDNLFIPMGTFLVLYKLSFKPTEEVLLNLMAIILVITVSFIASARVRKISFSGLVTLILFSYASWMLASFIYYVAIVSFIIGFLFMNIVFSIKPKDEVEYFRVKPILYIILFPFIIVFLANSLSFERFMFPAFLSSGGMQFAMLWRHWFLDGRTQSRFMVRHAKVLSNLGVIVSGIFVFPMPFIFHNTDKKLQLAILYFSSVAIADITYGLISSLAHHHLHFDSNRRLRLLITILYAVILFAVQATFIGVI